MAVVVEPHRDPKRRATAYTKFDFHPYRMRPEVEADWNMIRALWEKEHGT